MTDEQFKESEARVVDICKDLMMMDLVGMIRWMDERENSGILFGGSVSTAHRLYSLLRVAVALRAAQGMADDLRLADMAVQKEERERSLRDQMDKEFAGEMRRVEQLERGRA